MNILIAESMPASGVELLTPQPGWHVILSNPEEFRQHLPEADALIVRNAVKVDAALLAQAPHLKVIGKAGVSVDNIDVEAATAAGVLVMNTPGGNAVSVAEHTLGLMLAMARSIPQAAISTKTGHWTHYVGTELRGKTLGVVGLGSIGQEVVRRARAFEMKIVANDPYLNSQSAADLGATLKSLNELFAQSDYITLHVALTLETYAILNAAAFAKMKKGVRIVNCARGELIDGAALFQAIESGKVAGAALDVFQTEPPDSSEPLLKLDQVIATPHIGGATEEAQETVGIRIAEQIVQFLRQGVALNSLNAPAMSSDQYRIVGPYAALAERLGNFAAHVAAGNPRMVRLIYQGGIAQADHNTHLIRNAGLAGVLSRSLHRKANVVNAVQIAAERGLGYAERHEKRRGHADSLKLELETDEGITQVEGALVLDQPRLLSVDGIRCEAPLTGHLVYLRNADVPGVIGYVGSVTGKNKINIANFSLGRQSAPSVEGGVLEAIAVVKTDEAVREAVLDELLQNKSITVARAVEFRD
jgi:D-3-phosphoglycerate dehydrogenase